MDTYVPIPSTQEAAPLPSLPDPRTPVTLLVKNRPVSEVVFMLAELLHLPLTFDDKAHTKARNARMTMVAQGASAICVLNWCARASDTKVHWWACPPRVHFGEGPPADALGETPLGIDLTPVLEDFNPNAPPREFSYRTDPQKRRDAARILRLTMEAQVKAQKKPDPALAAVLEKDEALKLMLDDMGETDVKSWAETLSQGSAWTPEELKGMSTKEKVEQFRGHLKKKFDSLDKPLKEFIKEEERGLKEVESALKAYDEAGDATFRAFLKSRGAEGSRVADLVMLRSGRPLALKLLSHGALLTGRCRPHEVVMAQALVEALDTPTPHNASEELHGIRQSEASAAEKLGTHVSNTLRARWLEDVLYDWAVRAGISLAIGTDLLPSRGQILVNRDNGMLPAIQSIRELAAQHGLNPPVEDEPACLWIGPDSSWRFQDPQPATLRAFVLPDADTTFLKMEAALKDGPGFAARGPGRLLVVCLPPHRERIMWQILGP